MEVYQDLILYYIYLRSKSINEGIFFFFFQSSFLNKSSHSRFPADFIDFSFCSLNFFPNKSFLNTEIFDTHLKLFLSFNF